MIYSPSAGLWLSDLAILQILQEYISDSQRGAVFGTQFAIQNGCTLVKFVLVENRDVWQREIDKLGVEICKKQKFKIIKGINNICATHSGNDTARLANFWNINHFIVCVDIYSNHVVCIICDC
jgi:hypothetical protein